jgi:uncharacterized membrane protein
LSILRKAPWFLLIILALAAFLRLFCLGCESLWLDEAFSAAWSRPEPISIIESTALTENKPPLYYVLLHYWMIPFGQSDTAIRALSACLGIASVYLLYRIGQELFNRRVGILASFLMAINAFAVNYSQEARQYSLLLFLTLVSFLCFLHIVGAERIKKTHVFFYITANTLLCYTHMFGLFIIMSQVFYFLLFRHRYVRSKFVFWGAQIVTLLFFAPWIFVLIRYTFPEATHGLDWIPEPTVTGIADTIGSLSGAGYLWRPAGILFVLIILLLCFAGVFLPPENGKRNDKNKGAFNFKLATFLKSIKESKIALLLIWILFPFVLSLVLSLAIKPIFVNRFLIGITPALFLLTALGICRIDSVAKAHSLRVPAYLLLALLIAMITLQGLHTYYALPQKTQWREAANMITHNAASNDGVFVYDKHDLPFYYYYLGSSVISVQDHKLTWKEDSLIDKDRVWVVFTSENQDEYITVRKELIDRYGRDSLVLQEDFHQINVYLFNK